MKKIDKLILEAYGEVLNEMPKGATLKIKDIPQAMVARLEKQYGPVSQKDDFFSQNMDTYFKFTGRNKTTGSVEHKIIRLPSFFKMYQDFEDIVEDIKSLMRSDDIRKDAAARELFELIRTNFRKLQRYLRTERPEQYSIIRSRAALQELFTQFQIHASLIHEAMDVNDPVLMKMRALKSKLAKKKDIKPTSSKRSAILSKLKAKRAQVMRDMEQEAEPEGGPIADDYGAILNDIDKKIDRIMTVLRKYDMNEEEDDYVTDYEKRRREEDDYYEDPDYYKEGVSEVKYVGPFVYSNRMSDEELKDMYDAALDGYANYQKGMQYSKADYKKAYQDIEAILKSRGVLNESLVDEVEDEPKPEEEGDKEASKDTVLEDATDQILSKFPTLQAAIIKLQTEDFKEFVDSIDWISPRPTEFRINLKNGQDYILKWTGTGFEAQIMGKRYYIDKIDDYQQALDKLAILYKEGPMTGAGEGEPADVDSGGSS